MKRIIVIAIVTLGVLASNTQAQSTGPVYTVTQAISDQAQRTTLAFAGLGMIGSSLEAQSFFPPGKVADYTGFQYLRDNDPDGMGHNTSFLTRVANNVIYILNDTQMAMLTALATNQVNQINAYGYQRYPLIKACRRLMDGAIPTNSTGLSLSAVKAASKALYLIDGQISFDRAVLYADIYRSMTTTQINYLAAMKGNGFNSWPNITDDQIKSKMQALPPGTAVAVMTYAGDLFSWYAGNVDADVYFCPERHGTYFGSFYMKDAPAVGHEGYSISTTLTAEGGAALCDSTKGYVTPSQAALFNSLVDTQRTNLYAGVTNIVQVRTDISTALRSLIGSTPPTDAYKAQVQALVLAKSATYGELDGENVYHYASVFAQLYQSLSASQKTNLVALRKSFLTGTYSDGTPFDYPVCTTPFLYSAIITDTNTLTPYIANTDYLFDGVSGTFTLTSDAGVDGGMLPIDYTMDGSGATPALFWANAPTGTTEFAMLMTTLPGDGTTKWNWVLYGIPAAATGFAKNSPVGTAGMNSDTGVAAYAPPQSQGPGAKLYTFTIYALSASPTLPASPDQVTGDVLTAAIASNTLASASLNLYYTRTAPVAAFAFAQTGATEITFTNASGLSAISWIWNFGDGTGSTQQNPRHTYATVGTFSVSLTVSNAFGSNTTSKSVTVTTGTSTLPAITNITHSPVAPTSNQPVTIFAQVTDDAGVASVTLTYGIGTNSAVTNLVFSETMATTDAKPWTGTGGNNSWLVTGTNFEQRTGSNYGPGNPCGLEFKLGTTNLTDSMVTTAQGIDARGTTGYIEFWLWADGLTNTMGWSFQVNAGTGYTTRLSELTGANHGWQLYHYDLQPSELVSNLFFRFQCRGGAGDPRIDIDQISCNVLTGGAAFVSLPMNAAGGGMYTAQIPAQIAGDTVFYSITASNILGLTAVAGAGNALSYSVTNPVINIVPAVYDALLAISNRFVIIAGETNLFTVAATDSAGLPLAFQWDFGDGTTNAWTASSFAAHVYSPSNCGPYAVRVTASDGTVQTSSDLAVVAACQLNITRLQATLNFGKLSNDTCRVRATLDLTGASPTNQTVIVDIGGAQQTFQLNSKARGVAYTYDRQGHPLTVGTCRLTFNKPTGLWTLTARLSKGTWRDSWDAYGLHNDDISTKANDKVTLPVVILIGNEAFAAEPTLNYTAKLNKTGTAK